jgi:taurine dioxygenase
VTRLHTETGERGLLIGASARRVLGLADAESRTVLDLLQSFVARPHNVLTWTACPGDVLVADARSIQVRFPARRAGLVVRTVTGDAPLGINGQHSHLPAPAEPGAVRRSA